MVKILIKKLQSQESGYSGETPNQRGKYILIPKDATSIFPTLSKTILNDFKKILLLDVKDSKIFALNFVWHNAKYHPSHSRAHNEHRIYRTSMLDEHLLLDKDDIVVIVSHSKNGSIPFLNIKPNDKHYEKLNQILNGNVSTLLETLNDLPSDIKIFFTNTIIEDVDINKIYNQDEIVEKATKNFLLKRKNESQNEDPLLPLSGIFRNQDNFKEVIRNIYGNKCAIRKTSLVEGSFVGLEAAHILPKSEGGNFLPSNGLLLSSDLHSAFDKGYFTLEEDNSVLIWDSVPKESSLWKFSRRIVKPIDAIYRPFRKYTEYHRNNVFGKQIQFTS